MHTKGGFLGGILKFYDGKRKDGKNFWRQEGGDAIERFSIVMLLMNHYIREVPDFLMSLLCAVTSFIYIIIITFTFLLL